MKYSKENKASVKFLKNFVDDYGFSHLDFRGKGNTIIRSEVTLDSYTFRRLYQSLKNVLKLLDDVRDEGYRYRIGNEEFRKQEERLLFKKSRLHKDFGKQSFEDLCKLFENDDCDFEYYKRIYADDIDQLIKENYDHIPRID